MTTPSLSRRSLLLAGASAAVLAAGAGTATADPRHHHGPAPLIDRRTPRHVRPRTRTAHSSLVFSDEFTGSSLDSARWNAVDQHRSPGNNGVDYWYKSDNVSVGGDRLDLGISQLGADAYGGSRIDSQSKFSFTFGTIEVRALVPPTVGHLGAIWLQAVNGLTPGGAVDGTARDGAEVDIIESFSPADEYGITIHWDGYGADHQQSNEVVNAPGLHQKNRFHVYTTEWTSTRLDFFYDGTLVRSITDPDLISQVPEFPILSNEVIGYAKGDIHDATFGPESSMYVDYVRIWQ